MTRITYRPTELMSEQARALTVERGDLNVYRALANAVNVFTGWMQAGRAALTSTVLPTRLRELVILRVGHLMECPYEIIQHTGIASAAGLGAAEIAALTSDSHSGEGDFSTVESAVIELTTQLVTTNRATAKAVEAVHRALGAEATMEVLMVINRWSGLALMLNALEVDIDETARIAIPDARQPEAGPTDMRNAMPPSTC